MVDVTAADFVVAARQSMDGTETWVFIGDEQGLEISLETASRISRVLSRLLDEISGTPRGDD